MKGFLSVLAFPALILPALAAPTPAQVALQKKDLVIMEALYKEINGPETEFQNTMKSLNGAAPSNGQIQSMESEMKTVIAALKSAKSQIEAVNAGSSALSARAASTPGAQLLAALDQIVTEIGQGVAAGIASGSFLTTELGNLEDQALGALTALGGPLSNAIPEGVDEISSILESILGGNFNSISSAL